MICCWFYVLLDFFLRITKKVSTQPTPTLILTPTLAQAQARSERDFAARCGSSEKEMRVPSQKRKQFWYFIPYVSCGKITATPTTSTGWSNTRHPPYDIFVAPFGRNKIESKKRRSQRLNLRTSTLTDQKVRIARTSIRYQISDTNEYEQKS